MNKEDEAGGLRFSFVMPAYNEVDNIHRAVESARRVMEELAAEYEIIVVNDGSTDGTGELLEKMKAEVPELRVVHHDGNAGYGTALRNGFAAAQMPLIFYTDSDNQFDVGEIRALLPHIDAHPLVIGFRIGRKDRPLRLFFAKGFNLLVRLAFGLRVRDTDCAFKLFRREIFEQIAIESDKYFVDGEILVKARALGMPMKEVGVRHYPRTAGHPKVRLSAMFSTFAEMARIRRSVAALTRRARNQKGAGGAWQSNR